MRQEMPVSRLLTDLEALVRHHEKQEAYQAEQEVFHREQRAVHVAELQTARERLAAYRVAAPHADSGGVSGGAPGEPLVFS